MSESRRRPVSVTLIGWLFILVGVVVLARSIVLFSRDGHAHDFLYAAASAILAAAGGAFILRGHTWARWALAVWLGFHVGLGAVHEHHRHSLVVHSALFVILVWLLFRPAVADHFRRRREAQGPGNS